MKEIQQLRRIAVKLGVSGTAIPIAETRLYKGGYGFVVLQCYVPYTPNRSPTTSPLCTVFRTTIDKCGNRKQFNKDIYNLMYTTDAEIERAKYMVYECPLPKAFTDTEGELELVFTYSEVDAENKAVSRLASGIYRTSIAESDVTDGETVDPTGGELARLNDITVKVELLEDSIDALLQPPDNTDADKIGTPNVTLTEDGRLKFSELKGDKGSIWYNGKSDDDASIAAELEQAGVTPLDGDLYMNTRNGNVHRYQLVSGDNVWALIGCLKGPATIEVGTVTTGQPGTEAKVVNSGEDSVAVFNFTIPRGDTGITGRGIYRCLIELDPAATVVEINETNFSADYPFPSAGDFILDATGQQLFYGYELTDSSLRLTYICSFKGEKGDKGDQGETNETTVYAYMADVAASASGYTKGGAIDRRIQELEARIAVLEAGGN